VLVDEKEVIEFSHNDAPDVRYAVDDVKIYCVGCKGKKNYQEMLTLSDGKKSVYHNQYDYTEQTYETQILATDPAKIISDGNITINGQTINNDNSQIIAGQRLAITAQQLNNISTIGERRITRSGTRKYSYQYKKKGSRGTKTY